LAESLGSATGCRVGSGSSLAGAAEGVGFSVQPAQVTAAKKKETDSFMTTTFIVSLCVRFLSDAGPGRDCMVSPAQWVSS
jgi:hypothetical protein